MSRKARFALLSVVFLSIALTAAACGSSGSSTDSGGSGDATAVSGDDCVSKAQAATTKALEPTPVEYPAEQLDAGKLAGKEVWVINVLNNQLTQTIGAAVQEAGGAADINVKVIDGQGTLQGWQQAISTAVAQKVDAIIINSIDPKSVMGVLKPGIDQGMVVVDVFNRSSNSKPPAGVFGQVTPNFDTSGKKLANWVLADSGCEANVAVFSPLALQVAKDLSSSFTKQVDSECPDCKTDLTEIDLTSAATTLGPSVTSALRADPDVNYVFPTYDSSVVYVKPSLAEFPETKLISHDGVAENLAEMRKGSTPQVADMAYPPYEWIGWTLLDQAMRGLDGDKPAPGEIPVQLVDDSNIGENDAEIWPDLGDYKAKYKKIWGLG